MRTAQRPLPLMAHHVVVQQPAALEPFTTQRALVPPVVLVHVPHVHAEVGAQGES